MLESSQKSRLPTSELSPRQAASCAPESAFTIPIASETAAIAMNIVQ
ncbi:hypothetical protein [Bradyrhizobium sp.]|nr:hypothetical protein [Bradyrhizobium sp.]